MVNQQESGYLKFRQYEPNSPVCDTKKQCHNCKQWFWASNRNRNSFNSDELDGPNIAQRLSDTKRMVNKHDGLRQELERINVSVLPAAVAAETGTSNGPGCLNRSRESSLDSTDHDTGPKSRSSSCGGTSGSIESVNDAPPPRSILHSIRDNTSPSTSGDNSPTWELDGHRIHFCGNECMWSHKMRVADDERSSRLC